MPRRVPRHRVPAPAPPKYPMAARALGLPTSAGARESFREDETRDGNQVEGSGREDMDAASAFSAGRGGSSVPDNLGDDSGMPVGIVAGASLSASNIDGASAFETPPPHPRRLRRRPSVFLQPTGARVNDVSRPHHHRTRNTGGSANVERRSANIERRGALGLAGAEWLATRTVRNYRYMHCEGELTVSKAGKVH